jgi:hypothetical protein
MVIDNPGIREIALWDGDGGIEHAFPEIERLALAVPFFRLRPPARTWLSRQSSGNRKEKLRNAELKATIK